MDGLLVVIVIKTLAT